MIKTLKTPLFDITLFPEKVIFVNRHNSKKVTFSSLWLKFNAFEEKAYNSSEWTDGSHQYTSSKPLSTSDDALLSHAELCETAGESVGEREKILVHWEDGTQHSYSLNWLWKTAVHPDVINDLPRLAWKHLRDFQTFDFNQVMNNDDPSALIECLSHFFVYGVSFINNVPAEQDVIRQVANRLSIIQNTQFEDVFALTMKENPTNLAEVSGPVYLHNDIVFRKNPPAIQILHVIKQAEEGGENLFVDGLNIVQQLTQEEIELLRTTPLSFVNQSNSLHYRSVKPILVYDLFDEFQEIHFNKDKMAFPTDTPRQFYDAYHHLETLLEDPNHCDPSFVIPEHTITIMDNLRLLHGRKPFTDPRRFYVSCYVYDDELKSRYRVLVENQTH